MEDKNLLVQMKQRMLSDKPKLNTKKRQKAFNLNENIFYIQKLRLKIK